MENEGNMLGHLIKIAEERISQIESGKKPALSPDEGSRYFAEVIIDLDQIIEPMIADPDVHNDDVSKRYTHDTIRELSFYNGEKLVDLGSNKSFF